MKSIAIKDTRLSAHLFHSLLSKVEMGSITFRVRSRIIRERVDTSLSRIKIFFILFGEEKLKAKQF